MRRITQTSLAVIVIVLGACTGDPGGEDGTTVVTTGVTTSTTTSSTTSTTLPVTTTSSTSTTSTTIVLPEFPPGRENLTHGGDTWAVVLAASEDIEDPALSAAEDAATEAGYVTGPTDCDFGASAALGLPDDGHYYTVSVYLETEEDAVAAQEAFAARTVEGVVAVVQTFCLD